MADRKRILIADDDGELNEMLTGFLSTQDFDVVPVFNGKDALQKAQNEKFALLLLDVMMPYIDGYHVAYEISNSDAENIPKIIIMTSRDVASEKGIASLSGAYDAVQKPFELEKLVLKIKEALGEK